MSKIIADPIDFKEYKKTTDTAKDFLLPADAYLDDLFDLMKIQDNSGIKLPWQKYEEDFSFRAGEMTVWAGPSSHGKSLMTGFVSMSLISQGEKVAIASFEMPPAETLARMLRNWTKINPFTSENKKNVELINEMKEAAEEMVGHLAEKGMKIFNHFGDCDSDTVIGMVRYAAIECGINHIFIDNLQKCIKGADSYNEEKDFVSALFKEAKDLNVHIHLIHHIKKMNSEDEVPNKYSIKGSSAITDAVDNVFIVWRNKPKENDIKEKGDKSEKLKQSDVLLRCIKQRNYKGSSNGEFDVPLFFHGEALQYKARQDDPLMTMYKYWPHGVTHNAWA